MAGEWIFSHTLPHSRVNPVDRPLADATEPGGPAIQPQLHWARLSSLVRQTIAGFGFSGGDLDDLAQDVAVSMLRETRVFACETDIRRWLTRVTVNRCHEEFRRRGRFQTAVRRFGEGRSAMTDSREARVAAPDGESLEAVRRALADLTPDLLTPMVLRYWVGQSSTEIAAVMDVTPDVVRDRLRRGRIWLADALKNLNQD